MSQAVRKILKGIPIKVEIRNRYVQFNRSYAIRDVFDALVELITNSDDSYHRMYLNKKIPKDGGPILVEYLYKKGSRDSTICVKDRAEGMTLSEMVNKMGQLGDRTSAEGDRGFMARGARDCAELGKMKFESIKDNKYYSCNLTTNLQLIPNVDLKGESVTKEIREQLGIHRGNGTVVTISIQSNHRVPRFDKLVEKLPLHFALRYILSQESATDVKIRNLNNKNNEFKNLVFREPEGDLIIENEEYEIPGYPEAKAYLTVKRSRTPFDSTQDRRFRRSGLYIKGKRAIHECNLLKQIFENDKYAQHYYGKITCSYIDELLKEFDSLLKKGSEYPTNNPRLLVDPNRQEGLLKVHPFTPAILQIPSERLRKLISQDREKEKKNHSEVANQETKKRLKKLAKAASKFMKETLDDLSEITLEGEIDSSSFAEKGIIIIPTYAKIQINEIRTLSLYIRKNIINSEIRTIEVKSDNPGLLILNSKVEVINHPKKEDRVYGKINIKGEAVADVACIEAKISDRLKAEALVEVIKPGEQIRDFNLPLEFESQNYKIRYGSTRTLKLYAQFPDIVNDSSNVKVWTDNNEVAVSKGRCVINPISNSNYALAEIRVEGRRLNGKTIIYASVNGRSAEAKLKIIEKLPAGVSLEFVLRDEDFGNYRAKWAVDEGKPNLLKISSGHESIKRYLGPPPSFEGQDTPVFRIILAEIITESLCRRLLELDAKAHPWEFLLADYKVDSLIVNTVMAKLHSKIKDFVAIAHSTMLSNAELKNSQIVKEQ